MKKIKYLFLAALFVGLNGTTVASHATVIGSNSSSKIQNEGEHKGDHGEDHAAGTQGEEKEESCH